MVADRKAAKKNIFIWGVKKEWGGRGRTNYYTMHQGHARERLSLETHAPPNRRQAKTKTRAFKNKSPPKKINRRIKAQKGKREGVVAHTLNLHTKQMPGLADTILVLDWY